MRAVVIALVLLAGCPPSTTVLREQEIEIRRLRNEIEIKELEAALERARISQELDGVEAKARVRQEVGR